MCTRPTCLARWWAMIRWPTPEFELNREARGGTLSLREARLVGMCSAGTTHYNRLDTTGLTRLRAGLWTPERIAALSADAAGVGADAAETKVLASFLEGEPLKEIPASLKKRQVILRWLLADFETGRNYAEKEINEIIGRRHPDFATLRRELIVGGLRTCTSGIYRRT